MQRRRRVPDEHFGAVLRRNAVDREELREAGQDRGLLPDWFVEQTVDCGRGLDTWRGHANPALATVVDGGRRKCCGAAGEHRNEEELCQQAGPHRRWRRVGVHCTTLAVEGHFRDWRTAAGCPSTSRAPGVSDTPFMRAPRPVTPVVASKSRSAHDGRRQGSVWLAAAAPTGTFPRSTPCPRRHAPVRPLAADQ